MKIDIQEQLDKAIALLQDDKSTRQQWNDAEDIFNGIYNLDRTSPVLLFYLGSLFMKKNYNALAEIIFKYALTFDPNLFCLWNNLGYVHREDRKMDEARDAFKRATEIKDDESDSWMNYGAMFVAIGEPDQAIRLSNKAIALDPDNFRAKWNRSLARLEKGDYKNGWDEYDAGVRTNDRNVRQYHASETPTPRWDGTKGQTVVVYGEQGIGDEIMFASMLPDMMQDCTVILDAHPRLYQIFRDSFPGLDIYGTRKDKNLFWPSQYKIDAMIPIGSLGKYYRNETKDFPGRPYLVANPDLITKYEERLIRISTRMKIGISWKGGTKQTNMSERNIPLEKWLPIFQSLDADFISLQYTEGAQEQINEFTEKHGFTIHHWQDVIDDYDETAGLVSSLDFVISIPQSVVHLAGALGKPTLQLTPKHAMWQMGVYGEDMPWYGFVKNIWQEKAGEWESVIEKAKEEICNLYQKSMSA